LVQDIIFSRGPKGAKFTALFVGGDNLETAEKVRSAAIKSMFPPFQVSVMIDPKGAYTTGAALVAKVEKALGGLSGKKAAILGATGPVGRVAATLCAQSGCTVVVGSRSQESADRLAKEIGEKAGGTVTGAQMGSDEEKLPILKGVDLILATAKAGVLILPRSLLEGLPPDKVVADVNAVPPSGVAGLKPDDDLKEIAPGIRGIGAIAIGTLKYGVEMEMLETIRTSKEFTDLDDASAMEIARRRLQ
ncbi:MAG: methylene-tetrahydromethanopterin dehydrogenase N-terminal domain-containing protein, partial [Candidatus Methylomirabilales bacterium]